jgi:hypothetical protein
MSSHKTISIDPDMFKISSKMNQRNTKKERPTTEIKFKQPKNKTIKYKKLLQFIRQKQETNYNKLLNEKSQKNELDNITTEFLPPKGEFEESLNFLNEIRENNVKQANNQISTLQTSLPINNEYSQKKPLANLSLNRPQYTIKNHLYPSNENVNIAFPSSIPPQIDSTNAFQVNPTTPIFKIAPQPSYGILKGGNLPTYRQYLKTLSKEQSTLPDLKLDDLNENKAQYHANMVNKENQERLQRDKSSINQMHSKLHYTKRKKTIRRTFYIGRSKYYSKIGVIINNKTIRNECSTKTHMLKQTPIGEVKKFLIKKGLIKIGSVAPNDVLRKMYESANMICGDIQNHNTEILLHNYINS